jgi:hypothetical protein
MAALQNLISDDYMAVNFENKVSSKEIEIATAKNDAAWEAMSVDEIHACVFGNTAIASGFISAQGKKADGTPFSAKVRFLAVREAQWTMATCGHTIVRRKTSAAQPELRRGRRAAIFDGLVVRSAIENRQSLFSDLTLGR